jgi:membrane peptidoglycan carboxypeptidase
MEQALALSINIPAIRTLNQIGIDRAIEMAHRLGITSPIPHNLSIAIGTSGVTVLEMASAYTAFATGGLHADPIAILRVEDKDRNVIEETVPRARRVLSQEVANQMDRMLRAVVLWGTASRGAGHIPEARGKTGTTQSERDAWFVGYTPQLLAAVWVGNDDNTPMRRATGGIVCAPIWASFMEEALKFRLQAPKVEIVSSSEDREPRRIRERRSSERSTQEEASSSSDTADSDIISVPICDESGQLATEACPSTHMEQFPRNEAPTERCSLHPGTSPDRFEEPRPRSADAPSRASAPPPPEQLSGHGRPRPPELQTEGSTLPGARSEVPRVRVRLCRQTGLLATDFCPDTIQRSLPIDEVPKAKCNIHLTAPR